MKCSVFFFYQGKNFQNPLTKLIRRDMMYNMKGGIIWIFS